MNTFRLHSQTAYSVLMHAVHSVQRYSEIVLKGKESYSVKKTLAGNLHRNLWQL